MSCWGSPLPDRTNRRASSLVNTPSSAVVYRLCNSAPGNLGASRLVTDLGPVLIGLPDPDRPQHPAGEFRLQPVPERLSKVLSRRDASLKPGDIRIQVAVIHVPNDLPADDVCQCLQVEDVTAGRIDLAGHHHLHGIVVTV